MNIIKFIKDRIYTNKGRELWQKEYSEFEENKQIECYKNFISEIQEVCDKNGYKMSTVYEHDKTFYPYPYYGMFNIQFYSEWLEKDIFKRCL